MVYETRHFQPLDPGRVGLIDPNEQHYWCEEFHCTDTELREAVDKVGDHACALREELCK